MQIVRFNQPVVSVVKHISVGAGGLGFDSRVGQVADATMDIVSASLSSAPQ